MIGKLGNVIWDLPVVGLLRPFGFLVGKSVKLSEKEEEDYNNFTKLEKTIAEAGKDNEKIDIEIAKLETRINSGDFKKEGAWGFGDTKADLEEKIRKKKAEKFANEDKIGKA